MAHQLNPKSSLTSTTTYSIFLLILGHATPPIMGRPNTGSADLNTWCYLSTACDQDSPISEWSLGVCKSGKSQSPIDIPNDYEIMPTSGAINFQGSLVNYNFNEFQIWNNGRSIQIQDFKTITGKTPTFIWPERNNSVYALAQIHFHWGASDHEGSEHTVGGKGHSMEMHLVHYRQSGGNDGGFGDLGAAVKSGAPDALSVIGVFFQGDDHSSMKTLDPVIKSLCKVPNVRDKENVARMELMLSEILRLQTKAVTYTGSLTTPGCNEIVAWLLVPEPVKISKEDLNMLRNDIIEGEKALLKNNRRTQPINNRPLGIVEFEF